MNLEQQAQSLLIATRKLLTPEERWGQGHYYADYDAQDHPQRFCLAGALFTVSGQPLALFMTEGALRVAWKRLDRQLNSAAHLHHWNDEPGRTHAEVLKLLDDTIGQEAK